MDIIIDVKEISKSYKDKKVLDNISFSVNKGDILGYIGPNGAGKTTTMKIICGICNQDEGKILVQSNKKDCKIGVVFDFNGLYNSLTARENLLFFLKLYIKDRTIYDIEIDRILSLVKLKEVKDKKVKNFSKGMLRRLALARALINAPNILILDEPFDGLDVESHYIMVNFLKEWVAEDERCIFFTSHNMNEVDNICSKLIIINKGKIIENSLIYDIKSDNFKCLRVNLNDKNDLKRLYKILSSMYHKIVDDEKGNNIMIYTDVHHKQSIINALHTHKIIFSEIQEIQYSLEEIYLKKVMGDGE